MNSQKRREFEEYFDPLKPTVSAIRTKYGDRFIDLNVYEGLTRENVAYAVLEAGGKDYGLIIPESFEFWDKFSTFKRPFRGKEFGIKEIELNSPLRFSKYGPEINILKSDVSIDKIKKEKLTPRKLLREVFSSPETKEKLGERTYRGWGYWDISSNTHRFVPFDVPAEGQKFRELLGDKISLKWQKADCFLSVPSYGKFTTGLHQIAVYVLPVIKQGDEYFLEWTKTYVEHVCPDRFFKKAGGLTYEDEVLMFVFKYRNTESVEDRHTWAAREIAEDNPLNDTKAPKVLIRQPRATGLMEAWCTLKTGTIIGTRDKARRPIITEIRAGLSPVHRIESPEKLYDLTETI